MSFFVGITVMVLLLAFFLFVAFMSASDAPQPEVKRYPARGGDETAPKAGAAEGATS